MRRVHSHILVLEPRHRDGIVAFLEAALADELAEVRRPEPEIGATDLFDPLVDLAEEGFVLSHPLVRRRHEDEYGTSRELRKEGVSRFGSAFNHVVPLTGLDDPLNFEDLVPRNDDEASPLFPNLLVLLEVEPNRLSATMVAAFAEKRSQVGRPELLEATVERFVGTSERRLVLGDARILALGGRRHRPLGVFPRSGRTETPG